MAVYVTDNTGDDSGGNPFTGAFNNIQNYLRGHWPGPGGAQAAQVTQAPNPAANPSPVDPRLAGGGLPIPSGSGLTGGGLSGYTGLPPGVASLAPSVDPITGLPTRVPTTGGPIAPSMPYAGGQGPMTVSQGPNGPVIGGDLGPGGPNTVRGFDVSGNPIWETDPRLPDFNKLPSPAGMRQPPIQHARIPANARANVPPGGVTGSPNDRFTTFQYQVPGSPGAGGRGGPSAPIYTALNLGGLFGGGGALAKNSTLAANPPVPPTTPADIRAARRANAIKTAALHSGFA